MPLFHTDVTVAGVEGIGEWGERLTLSDGVVIGSSIPYYTAQLEKEGWEYWVYNSYMDITDLRLYLIALVAICGIRLGLTGVRVGKGREWPALLRWIAAQSKWVLPGKEVKICEMMWYFMWHSFACVWGIMVLMEQAGTAENPGWVRNHLVEPSAKWWWFSTESELAVGNIGWPLYVYDSHFTIFYMVQGAFWTSCLIYLNLEVRRSDYYVMLFHHISTLALILFSYAWSYHRPGLIFFILHDVVDVLLYLTKTVRYTTAAEIWTRILFVAFVISYFTCRLLLFVIYAVWPATFHHVIWTLSQGRMTSRQDLPGGFYLAPAMYFLVCAHVYWFFIIVKMLVVSIFKPETEEWSDSRSEDDEVVDAEKEEAHAEMEALHSRKLR